MAKTDWANHLRFRHLRVLMTLHETGNLSKTARLMAMTQPALSKWLRELEDEIGSPLFKRHAKGLVPTPECDLLAGRAGLLINELDRTVDLLDSLREGIQGKLYVGTTPTASTEVVPTSVAAMHKRFPRAMMVVREGAIDILLPQLKDGRLNLIISALEDRDYGDDIALARLYREHMVVVCGLRHPLQGKRKVTWSMALAYSWVSAPRDSLLFRELQQELALANQPMPSFVADVSSAVLTSNILARTNALALMSRRSGSFFANAGLLGILKLPTRRRTYVGVLWRKGTEIGALGKSFVQQLQQASEDASL